MRDVAKAPVTEHTVALIDLQAQRARIAGRIEAAIARVLAHAALSWDRKSRNLSAGWPHTRARSTLLPVPAAPPALVMALMAKGVGRGDAVFVPSFTFTATAEVAVLVGATPVFVDVHPETMCMDAASLGPRGQRRAPDRPAPGLRHAGRSVRPAGRLRRLVDIARAHGMWVLDDAAQSYGASYCGRKLGTCADVTATSFYPSKPLGCYGDGGAVFTDDDELHKRLTQVRVHGQDRTAMRPCALA